MNDSDQYRFHDGNLVLDEQPTDSVDRDEPIKPGEETGYRVAVKSGAIDANARLRNIVQEYSQTLEFGSRSQVEHYVKKLSASDGELRFRQLLRMTLIMVRHIFSQSTTLLSVSYNGSQQILFTEHVLNKANDWRNYRLIRELRAV